MRRPYKANISIDESIDCADAAVTCSTESEFEEAVDTPVSITCLSQSTSRWQLLQG